MKCRYCNIGLKDGAKFCPNCGKEVIESNTCIKCGEKIKAGASFCPYCGTNQNGIQTEQELTSEVGIIVEHTQPTEEVIIEQQQEAQPKEPQVGETETDSQYVEDFAEESGSKKWIWILLALLICGGAGAWYYMSDGFSFVSNSQIAEVTDSDSIAITDEIAVGDAKEFVESMYKDFFENKDFDTENISDLLKYLSPSIAEKLKIECPYDGGEGDFSYVICFFRDGALSYERPDYGDKVVSRTIEPEKDGWFMVTNIWDIIKKPVKVYLQVKKVDGAYKVVDISTDGSNMSSENPAKDEDAIISLEEGISIEDAIKVAENMIVENGTFKGFRDINEVNYIMQNKYGYKYEKRYFSEREWDFSPFYYKNCIFPEFVKDDDLNNYIGTPKARGEGMSSFVGIDNFGCSMVISPFTKEVFNEYFNQIKQLGGTLKEEDKSTVSYLLRGFEITGFKNGVNDISYCITISKE